MAPPLGSSHGHRSPNTRGATQRASSSSWQPQARLVAHQQSERHIVARDGPFRDLLLETVSRATMYQVLVWVTFVAYPLLLSSYRPTLIEAAVQADRGECAAIKSLGNAIYMSRAAAGLGMAIILTDNFEEVPHPLYVVMSAGWFLYAALDWFLWSGGCMRDVADSRLKPLAWCARAGLAIAAISSAVALLPEAILLAAALFYHVKAESSREAVVVAVARK